MLFYKLGFRQKILTVAAAPVDFGKMADDSHRFVNLLKQLLINHADFYKGRAGLDNNIIEQKPRAIPSISWAGQASIRQGLI